MIKSEYSALLHEMNKTETSDIDIIIEMQPNTSDIFNKRVEFKEMLQKIFAKEVDVCHEKAIKPFFRKLILSEAIYV